MEIKKGIFQAWKIRENDCGHGLERHEIPSIVMEFFNRRIIILGV